MAEEEKASSPWPSSRKSEPVEALPESAARPPAGGGSAPPPAAWAGPLHRLDKAWTRLEARLCAIVLVTEIVTMVFWIGIKALSRTGNAGPGLVFRSMLTALVLGVIAHRVFRNHWRRDAITTVVVIMGFALGRLWGDHGLLYFANFQAWIENASIFVFFGGFAELAKRLTLWLALLGASLATGQGKHINVDIVMRFLGPRARVPIAVLGWVAAAVVSGAGAWGFFDNVAVEEFHVATSVPCAADPAKHCPAPPGGKIDKVLDDVGRDFFLVRKQLSLDIHTLPKVIVGTPYRSFMTAKDWNTWVREGGWEPRFKAEDVKALELPEDSTDTRTPAVTAIPGGTDSIDKILVPVCNLVFPFGLLVIAIRFILRSILAITGWVKVDPNAAHGDEELAHAHDHSAQADRVEQAMGESNG